MDGKESGFKVGAAQVDITPEMGVQIAGSIGIKRPAEFVMDPIFAKALVVEAGGRKVCVLSLDLLAITAEYADRIRDEAARVIGAPREAVMVHVTQNHAAPSLGHLMCDRENPLYVGEWTWMRGGDDRYHEPAVAATLRAVQAADAARSPAMLGVDRGMDSRVAFNRRYILRDGRSEMGSGGDLRNVLQREGAMDPEVGVACFQTQGLKPVALLLHHTCHPVHAYPLRYITAGWPGAWAAEMRRMAGGECVPLVVNGCCGNVIHRDILNPTQTDTPENMGRLLTETAGKVLRELRYDNADTRLAWSSRKLAIPFRELPAERLAAARKRLAETPLPPPSPTRPGFIDWDWIYDVAILDVERLRNRCPHFEYEIQAFRIGPLALVALMGEPFVEGQLQIKLESPFKHTFIAHMSNGYVGYVPTPEAIRRGGYETRLGWGSKLAPEALEMIVKATGEALNELREQKTEN
jgi:hypothetical protein